MAPATARAQDTLCDPAYEDCRSRLLDLIRNETVGIDVAFWFMEDARYSNEIVSRFNAGVPVRVLVDTRANRDYPLNAERLQQLAAAGIPMRRKVSSGILHWKMMMFNGQNTVQFSAANYSPWAFRPNTPYVDYTDEAILFTTDTAVVNSFRTKFDDLWINTSRYSDYANISGSLTRTHGVFPKDPALNFPPDESFRSRSVSRYNAETQGIDVIMYRITDRSHTDAIIAARQRGIPVRLYTEPEQYRDPDRLWHAWNVDRMYMAGVQIRHRAHAGLNHQKSVILRSQRMVIWGSSNWTSPSSSSQEEHNYFTTKPYFYTWFSDQFAHKWNNLAGVAETEPFVPLPPGAPSYQQPSDFASNMPTSGVRLRWFGDEWSHRYDVYFGTAADPPLLQANLELGPTEDSGDVKEYALPQLDPGRTYYWRIVSKTMANRTRSGPVRSFTTEGTAGPPPPTGTVGPNDIVLYAGQAAVRSGGWSVVPDGSAAGGVRMVHPDAGAAKRTTALASPTHYFEMTFDAEAGRNYRLWIRGRAQSDYWANDSVFIQFSGSVNSSGTPTWRIGTTSATESNLEDCSGCGLSGWGWQDNGWGVGVLGPVVRFATTGPQTIRIQTREDGLSIDQILLSPDTYLNSAPGPARNDATILPATDGGSGDPGDPPPSTDPSEIVLYAGRASTIGTWRVVSDSGAAAGLAVFSSDTGESKREPASSSPADYFQMTFEAEAGTAYRIWIRGKAQSDHWGNDSVYIQFSGSVNSSGSAIWRIGTTSATEYNLEDCGGCGLDGWGWQDNGWGVGVLGPLVRFATTGTQSVRVQTREDGLKIDQIVLSSSRYLNSAPGALTRDTTILPEGGGDSASAEPPPDPDNIILHAGRTGATQGSWTVVSDNTAAAGLAVYHPDAGAPKVTSPDAAPTDYFEMTFSAEAERAHRLWIRGRAEDDHWSNDSVFVQFSGSVDAEGDPIYRIGTASAAEMNLEHCSGCGLEGWGWQDNGWGVGVLGPEIRFATTGEHTMRIQTREDGLRIDQIVLSPSTYLTSAPGPSKGDDTILPESTG